jgi:hypothetical protein
VGLVIKPLGLCLPSPFQGETSNRGEAVEGGSAAAWKGACSKGPGSSVAAGRKPTVSAPRPDRNKAILTRFDLLKEHLKMDRDRDALELALRLKDMFDQAATPYKGLEDVEAEVSQIIDQLEEQGVKAPPPEARLLRPTRKPVSVWRLLLLPVPVVIIVIGFFWPSWFTYPHGAQAALEQLDKLKNAARQGVTCKEFNQLFPPVFDKVNAFRDRFKETFSQEASYKLILESIDSFTAAKNEWTLIAGKAPDMSTMDLDASTASPLYPAVREMKKAIELANKAGDALARR